MADLGSGGAGCCADSHGDRVARVGVEIDIGVTAGVGVVTIPPSGAYEVLPGTQVLGQPPAGSRWKMTTSSSATPSSTSRRRDLPCSNASRTPRPAARPS